MEAEKRKKVMLAILAILIIAWAVDSFILSAKKPETVIQQDKLINENIANADLNQVMVYVTGAVNKPGVVKMPVESRVVDAINAAGGLAPGADSSKINLAGKLKDGSQISVPGTLVLEAPADSRAGAVTKSGLVNINLATEADLDTLPGIGPATAKKIIDYRQANGNFKTIEEIKKVSGIGDAKFNSLKDKITI